ncbi:LOW QUALITY PROTEIN: reticulon-like protein B21 [Mangifera indica]|uniref:LOW QUALITY PROTEIN: reticulon-like protein B21 n=1 Tax=Mangifera indica TaxID=29780 RepID=UPI001CFABB4D|nr:LOW QUALITY PROTEIN: reticulon-like protein B21 [Mangifera indica]
MDVNSRLAGTKSGAGFVAAGSVWETRMKSDEVKGGIKVFNGEESNNNNNNLDDHENADSKKAILKRGQTKRKTWKSESFEGPIQVAKGKSSVDDGECKSPVLVKKRSPPIHNKKTRSELVKSKSEPINGVDSKGFFTIIITTSIEKGQVSTEPNKNEKFPIEKSEEEKEEKEEKGEEEEEQVVEVCQDKAISGEVKNVSTSKSPPQTFPDVEIEDSVEEDEEEENIDDEDEEIEIEKESVDIKETNVEELKPERVVQVNQFNNISTPIPVYTDFIKPSPSSVAEECHNFPQTHNELQNLVDLVMWRDVSKSALIFGIGTFIMVSSSYTTDLNISFISVISYLGLVYLAVIFLYRSIICRGYIDMEDDSSYVLGEEEAIWLLELFLPYLNEFLLKLKALFSGDPATTMKLAVLLFVLARCGNSITIWKMAKLGFFGVFIFPKVCSSYSTHITAFGKFWIRRFRDAWDSCSHKKATVGAVFTLVWNLSSTVARIWAVFVLFVAFRYYQQSMMKDDWVEDDAKLGEEPSNGPQIGQQKEAQRPDKQGQKPNNEGNQTLRAWRRPTTRQANKAKKAS